MGELEWSNALVERLVEAYRAQPALWDRAHAQRHVPTAKYEAWAALAVAFNTDIADLRKKITSVMASYRREKGRVRRGAHSAWFLYPRLAFLPNYLPCPGARPAAAAAAAAPSDDDAELVTVKCEPLAEEPPSSSVEEEEAPAPEETFGAQRHSRRLRRRARAARPAASSEGGALGEVLRLVRRADAARRDECGSFARYVAAALRRHDARTRATIKHAINNILFEQEMKKFSACCPSPTPAPAPANPLALPGEVTHYKIERL